MDKAKKKNIKKYVLWGVLAALVLILAVMPLLAKNEKEDDGPTASILSGTVQTGSVSTTLHGGGNLTAGDAEDVTVPAGVKITEFLVSNGDVVTEGTPLATVDKVTVMTAITQVRETMEYLQGQMEDVRSETVSSYITANAGGRVKVVYAEAGDSVQDVMLEHGALAVLSLDSLMAVTIQRNTDQVATGDTVCVTLSDDTEVSGRVESNLNGEIIITIDDEGYAIGEKVIVTTNDGDRIGSGELYVHNAWKATAFTGTISTVNAKEERTVSSGSTLFTLKDTEFTAQLEYLAAQHREYEELMQELFQMYTTGTINAPCDGIISGVDEESTHLLAAEETEYEVNLLDAETGETEEKGWSILLLSNVVYDTGCTDSTDCPLEGTSDQHIDGCPMACNMTVNCTAKEHFSGCPSVCTGAAGCLAPQAKHIATCPEKCTNNANCISSRPASEHGSACIVHCTNDTDASDGVSCTAITHQETCVGKCTESTDGSCTALNHKTNCYYYGITYTARAAKFVAFAGGNMQILEDGQQFLYTVTPNGTGGWTLVNATSVDTSAMMSEYTNVITPSNSVSCNAGDIILIITGTKEGYEEPLIQNYVYVYQSGQQSSTDSTGGLDSSKGGLASMMSGMSRSSGSYGSGAAATETFDLFDLEGDVLMTVTNQDVMTLTVTIDEQDISKVTVGQIAEVKVTALKNETFEAEVTKVAISGTNNGGSSKFTVELSMDKSSDMLDGMSATASIPLYTKMDVLTIPVAALVENGAETVVYTALDKETGEPASPVTVTIGVSDGETAEILSGLQSGDTFYYSYYDTLELSTEVKSSGVGFAFGR